MPLSEFEFLLKQRKKALKYRKFGTFKALFYMLLLDKYHMISFFATAESFLLNRHQSCKNPQKFLLRNTNSLLLNEKNELHNRNLHISGLLNEEEVSLWNFLRWRIQVLQNLFPIWCRRILLNRYLVMEKENINLRSKLENSKEWWLLMTS